MAIKSRGINNNKLGYSEVSLRALEQGKYDQLTGRDPKYRTSQDQLKQYNELPTLKKQSSKTSSYRSNGIDELMVKDHEPKTNIRNRGFSSSMDNYKTKNLRDRGFSSSFKSEPIDFDYVLKNDRVFGNKGFFSVGNLDRDLDARKGYRSDGILTSGGLASIYTPEEKEALNDAYYKRFGMSMDQVLDQYDAYKKNKEREKAEKHPIITAMKDIPSAPDRSMKGGAGTLVHELLPNSDIDNLFNNEALQGGIKDVQERRDYIQDSNKLSDITKAIAKGVGSGGDRAANIAAALLTAGTYELPQIVGGATGAMSGIPGSGTLLTGGTQPLAQTVPGLMKVLNGGLEYGITAQEKQHELERQGFDEETARAYGNAEGLASGIMSALLTGGVGNTINELGKGVKGLLPAVKQGAKLGAITGGGRTAASEVIEPLILKNQSTIQKDIQNYLEQGESAVEATLKALGKAGIRVGEGTGIGALIGGALGGAGYGLGQLFGNNTANLNDVFAGQAKIGQNEALGLPQYDVPTLEGMNQLALPEMQLPASVIPLPGTNGVIPLGGEVANTVNNTVRTAAESAARNPRLVIPLEGAELEKANVRRGELKGEIERKKIEVETNKRKWEAIPDKQNRKKAAAEKAVKTSERELKALQDEDAQIKKNIKGYTMSSKEYMQKADNDLYKEIYNRNTGLMDNLNYAAKFAGDSPEAKQLAKEIKDIVAEYIETGDAFNTILSPQAVEKVTQLDNLAKSVDKEYLGYHFKDIFGPSYIEQSDTYNFDNPSVWNKIFENDRLEKINQYYQSNFEQVEPITDTTSAPIQRSYKDLMPENPNFESDSFKGLSNNLKQINTEIDNLKNTKAELAKLLDKEVIGVKAKSKNEMTPDEYLLAITGKKVNKYTPEGDKIKKSIDNIDKRLSELYTRQDELHAGQGKIKKEASRRQRAEYSFSDPLPATQSEYQGFDITKATHNDEVQDAINDGTAFIAEMSPLEYLKRAAYEIFNDSTLENTIMSANSLKKVSEYAEDMRRGDKFPILDLRYDSKSGRGQEGLTRALAAYEAGLDKVPVAIIGKPSPNPYNSSIDIEEPIGNYNIPQEDIDNAFIEDLIDEDDLKPIDGQLTPEEVRKLEEGLAESERNYPGEYPTEAPKNEVPNVKPTKSRNKSFVDLDLHYFGGDKTVERGYWLRVLGDNEFLQREAQKANVDPETLKMYANYNLGYADIPNVTPNVPPSGDGNVPPNNVPPNNGGNTPPPNRGPINLTQDANGNVVESGTSKHIRAEDTAMKYDNISDEVVAEFVRNPGMYRRLKNADTKALADAIYNSGDTPVTLNGKIYKGNPEAKFWNLLDEKNPASLPLGTKLAADYSAKGNHDMAAQIYRNIEAALTDAGQFSQAAIISMTKNDPLTALAYMEKQLDGLNKAGAERYGKKWKDFELTDDEKALFDNIKPGDIEAIKNAYAKVGARIEKEYPATFMEKLLEFRRVAMLFNSRTIARNTLANVPTAGMRYVSDRIDGVGQWVASLIDPEFERTQAILGSNKETRKLAIEIYKSDRVQNFLENVQGRLSEVPQVGDYAKRKQVFKGWYISKFVNKLTNNGIEKLNAKLGKENAESILELARNSAYGALEITDSPFVRENFISRLGSYMKVKGITNVDDVPDEAIQIALEEALKATFKDNSWLVEAIKKAKGAVETTGNNIVPGLGNVASQALIPYVQAPGNIGARVIDYSAIGGTKGIADIVRGATKGDDDLIRKGINQFAKGATGALVAALGMALYKSGIITGSESEDKDQREFEKQNGFREFSLRIKSPIDGKVKYETIDWMQPFIDDMMQGVLLAQAIENSDQYDSDILRYFGIEGSKAGKLMGVAEAAANKNINYFFNSTPLKNLGDLFKSNYKGETDIAENIKENTIEDFASGLVPSAVNAAAKSNDPIQRQTYDPDNAFASFVNGVKAKVPWLSETLPIKYDTWGEPKKYGDSKLEAAFGKMLWPGEHTSEKGDAIDDEINRLFEATQNNAVFPQVAPYSVDGVKLTADEVSKYQETMGKRNRKLAETFINSKEYQMLNDDAKADVFKNLYGMSNAIAANEITGKEISKTYAKAAEIYKKEGAKGAIDNYVDKQYGSILNDAGLSTTSKFAEEVKADVKAGNTEVAQQKVDQRVAERNTAEELGFVNSDGSVNTDEYTKAVQTVGDDPQKLKYYQDYKSKTFTRGTDEKVPYVMGMNLSNAERAKLITNTTDPSELNGKGITGAYNAGGWDGVWYWRYLQYLADEKGILAGDGNQSVKKDEKEAMMNAISDPNNRYYLPELSPTLYNYFVNVPNKQW